MEREEDKGTNWYWFRRGFVGLLPLWAGAIPSGIAFGVAARDVGLSAVQTQVMSLTVFSAAAQLSATTLWAAGSSTVVLVLTAMALNAHLPLLGLAVGRQVRPAGAIRWLTGWLLTDGAFGIALGQGRLRLPTLIGAGASMYLSFNAGTAIGATAGTTIPAHVLKDFGIDLVAPLTFLAVLAPLIRTRVMLVVAAVAGGTAFLLARVIPSGLAVLGAGVVASMVGAWYHERASAEGVR
jgi:predicted branched-subunit amino acid permease